MDRHRRRISRESLARFCRQHATGERTLVVHSRDVEHERFFPNSVVLSKPREAGTPAGGHPYVEELAAVADESFSVVLCTGLLEHVPDPGALAGELRRVLRPGGRLILSASAVFSFHGGRRNYFHFTPEGLREVFAEWSRFEALQGSTGPFETVAILLHRINLQCELPRPLRLLLDVLYRVVPRLDALVRRQYLTSGREEESVTDAFMPATLHAVVVK